MLLSLGWAKCSLRLPVAVTMYFKNTTVPAAVEVHSCMHGIQIDWNGLLSKNTTDNQTLKAEHFNPRVFVNCVLQTDHVLAQASILICLHAIQQCHVHTLAANTPPCTLHTLTGVDICTSEGMWNCICLTIQRAIDPDCRLSLTYQFWQWCYSPWARSVVLRNSSRYIYAAGLVLWMSMY